MNEENTNAPVAPAENQQVNDAPAAPPAAQPTDSEGSQPPATDNQPHVDAPKKGETLGGLDMDGLLDQIDTANNNRPVESTDDQLETPPTPPEAPPEQPQQPEKPSDEVPQDLNQVVDPGDLNYLTNAPEDKRFSIAPVPQLRDPNPNETSQEYFSGVMLPAITQVVRNMVGVASRNEFIRNNETQQQQDKYRENLKSEIDTLIASKELPAYATNSDGVLDIQSEGGKVIAAVMDTMEKWNSKKENQAPERQIKSFTVAYRLYQHEQAKEQQRQAHNSAVNLKRQQAGVLSTSGNGRRGKGPVGSDIRKGTTLSDLDFETLTS